MTLLQSYLEFIKELELLKNITRTAWTSAGKKESTAEHSWRLALFTGIISQEFPELDGKKLLMMALGHDLGKIYDGDISAALLPDPDEKYKSEAGSVSRLLSLLEEPARSRIAYLWQEYEDGRTAEAKLVKALDKAETIIQHNQGQNPDDFDYEFNLSYGKQYFETNPLLKEMKREIDNDTLKHIQPL